ncbi:MAG TPA: multicopper oxidase domain-containing protein [Dongiaceae bacterium]|jgi:FtsP/CotA-like multicopper oxidase with cupredoxin domain|nr:multicopper oxidase domain-containing protein [Dongiaceae bacterium]
MTTRSFAPLSRRRFLASTALLAGAAALPLAARADAPALRVTRRSLEVHGRAASVFGLVGPDGKSGLMLDPGQRFAFDLGNEAGTDTIVHWHGQTPPPAEDGVTDTGYALALKDGERRGYDFAPRPGTHWMHSHHGLQEQLLLAAPLIVHGPEDLRRDAQEVVVLLHDFSFRDPAELLAGLTRGGAGMGGMDMSNMPGMDMGGMDHGSGLPADLNDVAYDAYLANDRTLADPEVVAVERGGRVHLRLINGATATAFWIDLGTLDGSVVAADGNPVQPVAGRRFPMAQGQRLDILIALPAEGGVFPILAQREGDRARTGILLATPGAAIAKIGETAGQPANAVDNTLEARLSAVAPLAEKPADVAYRLDLTGSMMPYQWSIDGRTWQDRVPLAVTAAQRVEIELVNRSMMAHPMHLHGHHFQVTALDGSPLPGAMRDTVLVPVNGRVTIAFDADNPGRWLFHCHNLFHMATGMMTELIYA